MFRLFVAIRPPPEVREQLLDSMEGLPDARWQDDDQLHLTLRFIGEVDRHAAEEVVGALSLLRAQAFDLQLAGVGTFARKGRVHTLWAGVTPQAAVTALARKVDRACLVAGLAPETRAYMPHITLARFSGAGGAGVESFVLRHNSLRSDPFRIEHFGLYESILGRDGASYQLVERFSLA